jgi:hypothetical protein
MQANTNAFTDVLNQLIDDTDYKIVGTFEHLPIMQFILIERYEGISKKAKALNDLLSTGIPKEVALEMCGFDKDLQLEDITVMGGTTHMMHDEEAEQEGENIDGEEDEEENIEENEEY